MTLKHWMSLDDSRTQIWFSSVTGLSQSLLSKYLRGEFKPKYHNRVVIEKATDGAVPAAVWDETADLAEEDDSASSTAAA